MEAASGLEFEQKIEPREHNKNHPNRSKKGRRVGVHMPTNGDRRRLKTDAWICRFHPCSTWSPDATWNGQIWF
ncbi:hypothetical protein CJ030_MR4G011973 [Morella rubra]|uniref:Uncharacterized protein n=1 Tax=Morella rubra TaxID=262757 RepID=A0A6A1VVS7_9ROSI|nr:hypothetical protein CJ030_MR4G011973 [Morella rubra]